MNTNMRRIILVLAGVVLPLFTASSSTACSTPGLQPGAASWAPNADVAVNTTGVQSVVTTAIANWGKSGTDVTFSGFSESGHFRSRRIFLCSVSCRRAWTSTGKSTKSES